MKRQLDEFIQNLSNHEEVGKKHSELMPYFGYFLTEVLNEVAIRPSRIKNCYDAAAISSPANISDLMRKSKTFVKTGAGYLLHRDERTRIATLLTQKSAQAALSHEGAHTTVMSDKARNVMVVYGRDECLREEFFQFLRSMDVSPLEWGQGVKLSGHGSPYIGKVLDEMFEIAQAAVILLTPDEWAELRPELASSKEPSLAMGWQPRPNVLVEAGMALARYEQRTIIVQIGDTRRITDLEGRHLVHFDGGSESRNQLAQRLETAGCSVNRSGGDWLRVGSFKIPALGHQKERMVKRGRKRTA